MRLKKQAMQIIGLAFFSLLAGCATTTHHADDPLEGWNRGAQSFNDHLDDYALKPVAKGYKWIMPQFADQAVSNFFSNLLVSRKFAKCTV